MAVGSYSYKIELIVGTMFRLLVEGGWVLLQKKKIGIKSWLLGVAETIPIKRANGWY